MLNGGNVGTRRQIRAKKDLKNLNMYLVQKI
jgi:hypothetical protein